VLSHGTFPHDRNTTHGLAPTFRHDETRSPKAG